MIPNLSKILRSTKPWQNFHTACELSKFVVFSAHAHIRNKYTSLPTMHQGNANTYIS